MCIRDSWVGARCWATDWCSSLPGLPSFFPMGLYGRRHPVGMPRNSLYVVCRANLPVSPRPADQSKPVKDSQVIPHDPLVTPDTFADRIRAERVVGIETAQDVQPRIVREHRPLEGGRRHFLPLPFGLRFGGLRFFPPPFRLGFFAFGLLFAPPSRASASL